MVPVTKTWRDWMLLVVFVALLLQTKINWGYLKDHGPGPLVNHVEAHGCLLGKGGSKVSWGDAS